MNTKATLPTAPAQETFDYIPVDQIDLDVANHRLIKNPEADAELAKAIAANGIQQPIRLNHKADGRYTLVFGFRRLEAARTLGMATVPALAVSGLSVAQIQALQAIENLERKELHPLEEAQFCDDLAETLTANGLTRLEIPEAIAQRIGRSIAWVDTRLAMARLSQRVKEGFIDGDIHLGHVKQIARLASPDAQEEVLGEVKAQIPAYYLGDRKEHKQPPATIAKTRELVEKRMCDLSSVAWLLHAQFDGKRACTECPHNSANRLELFDGDQPKTPLCLLGSCYHAKAIFTGRAIQKATNTALKASDKPTKKMAAAAIKEREVEFIQPSAVIDAAKRRIDSKAETGPEKKGKGKREKDERKELIDKLYQDRLLKWLNGVAADVYADTALSSNTGLAMLAIIHVSEPTARLDDVIATFGDWGREPSPTQCQALIDIVAPDLAQCLDDDPLNIVWGGTSDDGAMAEKLIRHFHLDQLDDKPNRAAIEAELFPLARQDDPDQAPGSDELDYDQARDFVQETGKASISALQKGLRIGYNHAARLIEALEAAGVVGPMQSNGKREVLQ